MAKRKAPSGPSSSPSPAAAGADASPPVDPVSYSSSQGGSAGGRNRKGAAAAAKRKPRKPQVHEKNYAHVYYGCRNVLYDGNDFYYGHRYTEEFRKVEAHDLYGCPHLIAELPPQPRLMSLLDLQLWIIKLFRLHPETQDLSIKGFFEEEDSWQYLGSAGWKTYDFLSDKSWQSFVKKVKGRKGMEFFKLYVDSSEIKHYDSLLKATNDDYCQSATVLLPEQDDLTWYFPWDHISRRLTEDLAMTTTQIVAHLAHNYDRHLSYAGAWRAKQKALEIRFGTFYASHNYVPRLLKERFYINNPFSFVDIKDTELKGIECLPLTGLVEVAFERVTEYFNNRSAAANKATGNPSMGFPECVQDEMNAKVQKAQTYHVTRMNTADTNVFSNEAHQRFKVQSRQKGVIIHLISKRIHKNHKRNIACQSEIRRIARCSCNKARLLHKPCSHVIAVCCQVGVSIASYMSPFYSLSYLVKTWSGKSDASNLVDRNFARNVLNYKFLCPGETQTWIPDKRLERGLPAFLTSDRIHDEESMDEGDQNCTTQVITTENSQGTNKFSGETSDA
ncbi:hypothetical protein OsI_27108 [Oryza sativa Indica Group]|uniref:SWIM-type domain-containing protein n=1 Tax=Oryza sativa subsp. indica TaxID=39946 RepID=A2YPB8_ORYSI|nr:hypothetical protein OsI_27108 [Oryza sativa Indica Group]